MVSVVGAGFSCGGLGLKPSRAGGAGPTQWRQTSAVVVVRAEAINPEIRKTEEKVVDSVVVSELSKPLTAYCRSQFPPSLILSVSLPFRFNYCWILPMSAAIVNTLEIVFIFVCVENVISI